MKLTHYIYISAALATLTACSDDDIDRIYTVGEADNAIVLRAGVNEGGAGVQTRAGVPEYGVHSKHVAFTKGTKVALRIDGTWTGHTPSDIKQKTVATLGEASNQHNPLSTYDPVLYWDDYGMADPANANTGRTQGLTIYGAAVDGLTAAPDIDGTTGKTWTALSWNVGTEISSGLIDQSVTDYWKAVDLLTSNNVVYNVDPSKDNAFKFADRAEGKLLEFTHTMTKMTVVLTAGDGFPLSTTEPKKTLFESNPTVTLEGFYDQGTVNVEDKTSSPTTTSVKKIKMHLAEGGKDNNTATFDALVFPGNSFDDATKILTLTADGNTFQVTAGELNKAIKKAIDDNATTKYPAETSNLTSDPKTYDLRLLQAWNYKLLIKVNKTDIKLEATIVDWNEVEAVEETPKINITQTYGHDGSAFARDFDFFRSTTRASGYRKDTYVVHAEPTTGTHTYTFNNQLYWPDHQTHYFFRGVFPRVQTGSEAGWIPTDKVSTSTSSASTIAVVNAAYIEGTYPSDLAFGWPKTVDSEGKETGDDEICKVHTSSETQGICATEGKIYMNFKYVMSKVQVSLKSSGTAEKGDLVDLTYAVVEIIDGMSSGKIRISDGLHENYIEGDNKGNYTLNRITPESGFSVTTLDAVVPQEIADDVKIRITVKNKDGNVLDVYEAQLNQIAVKDTSPASLIGEWKPGSFYKYQLDIKKTAINVTATLTDWVPVEASEDVWF